MLKTKNKFAPINYKDKKMNAIQTILIYFVPCKISNENPQLNL